MDQALITPAQAPISVSRKSYVVAVRPHQLEERIALEATFTGATATVGGVLALQLGGASGSGPAADVVLPTTPFQPSAS
jgi:uncharacterized protein YcfJ